MYDDRFTMLKSELKGLPVDAIDAMPCIAEMIKTASFLIGTDGHYEKGYNLLTIAIDYADLVTEIRDRTTGQGTAQE
ncbi:hypothetical protein ID80_004952 [Salmonella enterica subsp. enterica serovar Ball]|nr:hypothetical protein [Salmonella enterica subsp. enterica serovar Ball]